jgi:hypothetical protein
MGSGATPEPARETRALPGRENMPPRRGWLIFGLGFYKDVAPTALGNYFGRRDFLESFDGKNNS